MTLEVTKTSLAVVSGITPRNAKFIGNPFAIVQLVVQILFSNYIKSHAYYCSLSRRNHLLMITSFQISEYTNLRGVLQEFCTLFYYSYNITYCGLFY